MFENGLCNNTLGIRNTISGGRADAYKPLLGYIISPRGRKSESTNLGLLISN